MQYIIATGFEELEPWVKRLPDIFTKEGTSIFKDRNEVRVFEVAGHRLNVKSFKIPNLVNRYVYVSLRGSKAARSFQNGLKFLESGASTPTPVAYIECLSVGRLQESYYISLQFESDFTLRDVLNGLVPDKENILIQWVRFTKKELHENQIYHLDYSPGNTLIRKQGDNYLFAVVDLNRMKFMPISFEQGLQNFRQLDCDTESLQLIASEYARLSNKPAASAIDLLLKFDRKNKAFRRRKGNFKSWLRGTEEEEQQ